MKRYLLPAIATVLSIGVIAVGIHYLKTSQFLLSSEYYGVADIETIDLEKLHTLINDKKSFALFVSQPACQASADLAKYLEEFTKDHSLKFYEISFSTLKDSSIIPELRFYPSFVIFHNGKVVDFLEANSDSDAPAYTSTAGFENWFTQYVKLDI